MSAPYHYGCHYSNSGTVLHFLVRLPPFTKMFLQYQGMRPNDHRLKMFLIKMAPSFLFLRGSRTKKSTKVTLTAIERQFKGPNSQYSANGERKSGIIIVTSINVLS